MKLFKRTPRPADDLGYGILATAIKGLAILIVIAYGLAKLTFYLLHK